MTDAHATARRQVERSESIIRGGGQIPSRSVSALVEYISTNDLYDDSILRKWVTSAASRNDYWVARAVLKAVPKLIEAGEPDDALAVLRAFVTTLTGTAPQWMISQRSFGHLPELTSVFQLPCVVSSYPTSWGQYFVQLQSDALFQRQEDDWPRTADIHVRIAEHAGEEPEQPVSFIPEYDNHAECWYYHYDDAEAPGALVKRAIEQGLAEAIEQHDRDAFDVLTVALNQARWGTAACQPLEALHNSLSGEGSQAGWLVEYAVGLLGMADIESLKSTYNWRRLLRRRIADRLDRADRMKLLETIRQHVSNDHFRANELYDLEAWDELQVGDRELIATARKADELFPPHEPREIPGPTLIPSKPKPDDELVPNWPHVEDHEHVKALLTNREAPSDAESQEFEDWLRPKLDALTVVLKRRAAWSESWFGELCGICTTILRHVKRQQATNARSVSLPGEALSQSCPWWKDQSAACLKVLTDKVPGAHQKECSEFLAWGSNDPLYTALCFLDELLATESVDESIEEVRRLFEQTVIERWSEWPSFTQSTALVVVRLYHWAKSPGLQRLAEQMAVDTLDAEALERVLHHILQLGSENARKLLENAWSRVEKVTKPEKIARLIGQALGDATVRARAENESRPGVVDLTEWLDELREDQTANGCSAWMELVAGVVWGAKNRLAMTTNLRTRHGDVWLELAQWAISEYCRFPGQRSGRSSLLRSIMGVLGIDWPQPDRRRLYSQLGDRLEEILLQADFGDYSMLLHEIGQEVQGETTAGERTNRPVAPDDALLVRLCTAAARRVVSWHAEGKTTDDLGYVHSLYGGNVAGLMKAVFQNAQNREAVRRVFPPIIDSLASVGLTELVTDLRLFLRTG